MIEKTFSFNLIINLNMYYILCNNFSFHIKKLKLICAFVDDTQDANSVYSEKVLFRYRYSMPKKNYSLK